MWRFIMINDKQLELSRSLFDKLNAKFPEIKLIEITESVESPDTLWVRISMPDNDDREIALREIASEMTIDILLNYGYHILIMIRSADMIDKKSA